MSKYIAAVVQAGSYPDDALKSAAKAAGLIREAASRGARLAVFPEAFIGGYPKGAAFGAPGVLDGNVSLSVGVRPTAEYCWEMTTDALIHSWDLARGIGAEEMLDPELVELVYERTLPFAAHLHETGLFAPPVAVPDDAPLQTKLLAIFGRRA